MDGCKAMVQGKSVTIIHVIPELVKTAQEVAIISCNIVFGFRSTGTFPFNRDTYTKNNFASAEVYQPPIVFADVNQPSTFDAACEKTMAILNEQAINEPTENVKLHILPMILLFLNQKIFIHASQLCFHNKTYRHGLLNILSRP